MTALTSHLSATELEARYEAAADPVSKSHFHAIWLLSSGYAITEAAAILSFSARWVRSLRKRYNEHRPDSLGDRRQGNGSAPAILTPEALSSLKERLKTPPDDGGLWTGPKVARWLAKFHSLETVHDQRGWDALMAIDLFHPETKAAPSPCGRRRGSRGAQKNCKTPLLKKNKSIRTPPSRSGRWMSTGSA